MVKRNQPLSGVPFALVDRSTGEAITSGTATAYIVKDGGTQAETTNAPVHKGNGQWTVNLTSAEMDAALVGVLVTHPSAVPINLTFSTTAKTIADLNDFDPAADVVAEVATVTNQLAAADIAEAVLATSVGDVEDTAGIYSLAGMVLSRFESAITGSTWTIRKTDGTTTFATRAVGTDAGAPPVVSVS